MRNAKMHTHSHTIARSEREAEGTMKRRAAKRAEFQSLQFILAHLQRREVKHKSVGCARGRERAVIGGGVVFAAVVSTRRTRDTGGEVEKGFARASS